MKFVTKYSAIVNRFSAYFCEMTAWCSSGAWIYSFVDYSHVLSFLFSVKMFYKRFFSCYIQWFISTNSQLKKNPSKLFCSIYFGGIEFIGLFHRSSTSFLFFFVPFTNCVEVIAQTVCSIHTTFIYLRAQDVDYY